jgi:hypothetical protein
MISSLEYLYTGALVAGNIAAASLMYLLGNQLFTALLAALGLSVLLAAALAERPKPQSESRTRRAGWRGRVRRVGANSVDAVPRRPEEEPSRD